MQTPLIWFFFQITKRQPGITFSTNPSRTNHGSTPTRAYTAGTSSRRLYVLIFRVVLFRWRFFAWGEGKGEFRRITVGVFLPWSLCSSIYSQSYITPVTFGDHTGDTLVVTRGVMHTRVPPHGTCTPGSSAFMRASPVIVGYFYIWFFVSSSYNLRYSFYDSILNPA